MFPGQHVDLGLAGHGHSEELAIERSSAEQGASLGTADLVGPEGRLAVQYYLLGVKVSERNGVEVVTLFCISCKVHKM